MLLLSCGAQLPSQPAVHSHPQVLFRGCRIVQNTPEGRLCIPSSVTPTVLWVDGSSCKNLQIAEDDRPLSADMKSVQGGCQLRPKGQSVSRRSTLTIRDQTSGVELWSLKVDRSVAGLFAQTDRMWSRAVPDLATADAEFKVPSTQRKHPHELLDIANARAVIFIRQGENEQALGALAELTELATRLGYPSIAMEAAVRRMVVLRLAGLPEEAEMVRQDAAPSMTPGASWDQIQWAWNAGLILRAQEQLSLAEVWIRKAVEYAERVDDFENLRVMLPIWADVLIDLDRKEEAQRVLSSISKYQEGIGDCQKAGLLANLGWLHLQLQLAQGETQLPASLAPAPSIAEDLLNQALALRLKCPDGANLANIHNGLAHVAFLAGRITAAKAAIDEARTRPGISNSEQMQMTDLEARILLKEGKSKEALDLFKSIDKQSRRHPNAQRQLFKCRVAVGSLEAMQAIGQEDPAVADEVRTCVGADSRLTAFDQRNLYQRARERGIVP